MNFRGAGEGSVDLCQEFLTGSMLLQCPHAPLQSTYRVTRQSKTQK